MAKITVKRSSDFINLFRKIKIYNNDVKIGEIKNGETKEFNIEPGNINIYAKIDWVTSESITISIKDGETKTFSLKSRKDENPFAISLDKNNSLFLKLEK